MSNHKNIDAQIMERVIVEFPACIECAKNHLSRTPTYFHTPFCGRGTNLEVDVLYARITERVQILEELDQAAQTPDTNTPRVTTTRENSICRECHAPATGTGWVAFHGRPILADIFPLCDAHADFDDPTNRPHGFLPGVFGQESFICAHVFGNAHGMANQ